VLNGEIKRKEEVERPLGVGILVRSGPDEALLNLSAALFCLISSNCQKKTEREKY
jgi:hypothetical protein